MSTDEDYGDLDELPAPPRKSIPEPDRELLDLAARALGAQFEEVEGEGYGNLHFENGLIVHSWNPMQFSGDNFDLMVDLDLDVFQAANDRQAQVVGPMRPMITEPWGDDKRAATRRAVVRTAAGIGKQRS